MIENIVYLWKYSAMTENITRIAKYNFWEGVFPELGIIRTTYLERISEFVGNKLVKVIAGVFVRKANKSSR